MTGNSYPNPLHLSEKSSVFPEDDPTTGASSSSDADAATEQPLSLRDGCRPELEAREPLTFALAAASDPAAHEALRAALNDRPYGWHGTQDSASFDDWFQLVGGGVTGPAASRGLVAYGQTGRWSRGAATLGLALADAVEPTDLRTDWERWTDPDTAADELVETFGIEPLPSPAALAAAAGLEGLTFDPDCR